MCADPQQNVEKGLKIMSVDILYSVKHIDCHELHYASHMLPICLLAVYYGKIEID